MFQVAQVVLTEGEKSSMISRSVAFCSGSWWTHAFVVTGQNTLVEAWVPKVRSHPIADRIAELETEDRAYVVLELPGITPSARYRVAAKAVQYVGRYYDVLKALRYAIVRNFWKDGEKTLICSRLVTASYLSGAGINLYPEHLALRNFGPASTRLSDIKKGYVTPAELLQSRLQVVQFHPSSRIPTLHHGVTS